MEIFARLTAPAVRHSETTQFHDVPPEIWGHVDSAEHLDVCDSVALSVVNRATRADPRLRLDAIRGQCALVTVAKDRKREKYFGKVAGQIRRLRASNRASGYAELLPLLNTIPLAKREAVARNAIGALRNAPPDSRADTLIELYDCLGSLPVAARPAVYRTLMQKTLQLESQARAEAVVRQLAAIPKLSVPYSADAARDRLREILPAIIALPAASRAKPLAEYLRCATRIFAGDDAALREFCEPETLLAPISESPARMRFTPLAHIAAMVRHDGSNEVRQAVADLYLASLEEALHRTPPRAAIPFNAPTAFSQLSDAAQTAILPRLLRVLQQAPIEEETVFMAGVCAAYAGQRALPQSLFTYFSARSAAPDYSVRPDLQARMLTGLAATIGPDDAPSPIVRASHIFERARALASPSGAEHLHAPIIACARILSGVNPQQANPAQKSLCTAILDHAAQMPAEAQAPVLRELGSLANIINDPAARTRYFKHFLTTAVKAIHAGRNTVDASIVRLISWLEPMPSHQRAPLICALAPVLAGLPGPARGGALAAAAAQAAMMPREIAPAVFGVLQPIIAVAPPEARTEYAAVLLRTLETASEEQRAMLGDYGLHFSKILADAADLSPRRLAHIYGVAAKATTALPRSAYRELHARVCASRDPLAPHLLERVLELLAAYLPVHETPQARKAYCRSIYDEAAALPHHLRGSVFNALLRSIHDFEVAQIFSPRVIEELRAAYDP